MSKLRKLIAKPDTSEQAANLATKHATPFCVKRVVCPCPCASKRKDRYKYRIMRMSQSLKLVMTVRNAIGIQSLACRPLSSKSGLPVLTLYTKHPCPLCDDAKEVIKPLQDNFQLEEVDITKPENAEWFKKYRYEIPVFHFNGKFLMKNHASFELLWKALQDFHQSSKL